MKQPVIPPQILEQHVAVVGKSGSGKTSTAKLAIEQVTDAGHRVCILDLIKSDWWGLTSSADGKKPGLPYHILGGPRGHVPLHSSAGKAIGELVGTGALPLSIIDMADLEPGGLQRFFIDFAPALMRKMRGVLYLAIEEAHLVAPKERSGIGNENLAIHWAKVLATAGRSKGIRLLLMTQRTQALHNALLGSCDTMIAHRFTAPADKKPVLDWFKDNASKEAFATVQASMSQLRTGEGWIYSGEASIFTKMQFPRIRTYDNSATPTGTGDGGLPDVRVAEVDQAKLKTIIGDAVAEAEANDPKRLREELAAAQQQLANMRKTASPMQPEADSERLQAEFMRGQEAGRQEVLQAIAPCNDLAVELETCVTTISTALQFGKAHLGNLRDALRPTLPDVVQLYANRPTVPKPQRAPAAEPRAAAADGSPVLPAGERTVLTAIAQHANGVTREQLSILTSYRRSSRDTYLQKLSQARRIWFNGERIMATPAGMAALGEFTPLPTGPALLKHWLGKLPQGERRVLEAIVAAHPVSVAREAIDAQTGYSRSSRDTYLQHLAARELVTKMPNGDVKAAAELF